MIMEKGYDLRESLKVLWANINAAAVGTGLVATLFSTLGPGVIVMNAAKQGGLTDAQAVSWLFGIYVFGGLSTMFMALRYRIPVVIAYSIPGAVLLGKVLSQFTINEAVGAYMLVGLATFILTATGAIKKVVDHIPVPIMLGMVGGVLLSFGVSMFSAAIKTPSIYGVMLVVFFVTMTFRHFSQKIPPIMIAMIAGAILLTSFGLVKPVTLNWQLAKPVFVAPDISLKAILNISVPLFFLVIGVQNIQAVGVLMAEGYKPPINAMYLVPSIGAFINGLVGAHPAVTAGPSTAICSSSAAGERKEMRFIAAFFEGVFWFTFALSAKVAVDAVKLVPPEFTAVLAGLAMFDVFGSVFKGAFTGQFRSGAVVAFFVAITNLSILNIGAPFWAIIFGVLTSLLLEKNDFKFVNGTNGSSLANAKA
ncbi:benzoate/H(+) symporter BenE family transporter [Sporolituus thermophilus]|uniref:Benzoate membrane transport protein n=1 Tax=Sporolituus thermophilus DSM 23256 TaxID=1123285 RepID=A0A1G7IRE8_9FIRM|nr:benzoate/H(+) symporter BenE family transporter [Sporolituus thermophilus]SDF15165.1 benzoate membrane transport protein [Sporolituus thermophilus DSM 23256]